MGGTACTARAFSELLQCQKNVEGELSPVESNKTLSLSFKKRDRYLNTLIELREHIFDTDEASACVDYLIDYLQRSPVVLRGIGRYLPVARNDVGIAGNAIKDALSGQRGYFVSRMNNVVPDLPDKYAIIAKLLNHAGLDITRQNVRTIITNRERFR